MNKLTQLTILTEIVRYLTIEKQIDDKEIDIDIKQEFFEIEFLQFGLICIINNKISFRIFVDKNTNTKEKLFDIDTNSLRDFTSIFKKDSDFNEFIDDVKTLYNILKKVK